MHPAFSVIFLTTLIGLGQGLFLAIYTAQVYSSLRVIEPASNNTFYVVCSFIALVCLVAGLAASFFHLGHPKRAWRSAAMWRTSWLSREVIVLPLSIGLILIYKLLHVFPELNLSLLDVGAISVNLSLLVGAVTTLMVFALFICTGMIYACLKFLQEWRSWLTVVNFLLLGTMSGFMLATALSVSMAPHLVNFYGGWSIILLSFAFMTRAAMLIRNQRLRSRSSLKTAIGIRHNQITQKSQGSMGGSFNTREFFHGKTTDFLRVVKIGFIFMLFVFPNILLATALYAVHLNLLSTSSVQVVLFVAVLIQYAGLVMERWFFFAEARHPQNLYYQTIS